jgi:PAS domain S-box-containing protein
METGELDVDLQTTRIDSIGQLYDGFASMRDELKTQIKESNQAREQAEKLAEELKKEKQRSDERFKTLFETAPDPVVVVSSSGKIKNTNPSFTTQFGDGQNKNFTDIGFSPENEVQKIHNSLKTEMTKSGPNDKYIIEYKNDDEYSIIELKADQLVENEEVIGWVGILRDITKREQQRKKLEEKNDRLEQFASIVSHDLRNPLNVASGYLEAAKAQYETNDSGPLSEIEWAHDQMYQLIDELLTLARQGDTITDTTTVELVDIASDAWTAVETGEASVDLHTPLTTVEADSSRLSQLFENLFRNAIEHNSDDVTVRVGTLTEGRGFFIEDDGKGIPEAEQEDIFNHGYTTAENGTGFGLSIVERIATAHGWTVTVGTSGDGGARFEIYLGD